MLIGPTRAIKHQSCKDEYRCELGRTMNMKNNINGYATLRLRMI